MIFEEFKQKLSFFLGASIHLKVHTWRSRYLCVSKKWFSYQIQIHEIFLSSNDQIIEALAKYIKKKDKESFFLIRKFAYENLLNQNYEKKVLLKNLRVVGKFYNLQELLEEIFLQYFPDLPIQIKITWRSCRRTFFQRSCVFGSYSQVLKLIRINSILDTKDCPKTLISFIIYPKIQFFKLPYSVIFLTITANC